jgi:tetratricopeptide (TPR) repeat protein
MYAKFESEQGNIAKAQKLFEDALEDYTYVINRNPVNLHNGSVLAYAYNGRGITKIELGHIETDRGIRIKASELYESAIQDFDGSIKIIGTNARYYYNRGRAKEALGHNEEAKADFDKAKEIYPNVGQ